MLYYYIAFSPPRQAFSQIFFHFLLIFYVNYGKIIVLHFDLLLINSWSIILGGITMRVSMRNRAENVNELLQIAELATKQNMLAFSITNLSNVLPYLSPKLEPYWVSDERHYQFESTKLVPGILLWASYVPGKHIPLVAYGFDPSYLHPKLETALCQLPDEAKYLKSHKAIDLLRNAGAKKIFLATSEMQSIPSFEQLDEIFAHHYYGNLCFGLDGLEAYGNHLTAKEILSLNQYAHSLNGEVAGGDNYCLQDPESSFGKVRLPEGPSTKWLKNL